MQSDAKAIAGRLRAGRKLRVKEEDGSFARITISPPTMLEAEAAAELDRQGAEIARLTAALAEAREDALEEAAKLCERELRPTLASNIRALPKRGDHRTGDVT